MVTFICQECGKEYQPATLIQRKFCCHTCCKKYWNRKRSESYYKAHPIDKVRTCPVCGKEFEVTNSRNKYCSVNCKRFAYGLKFILTHNLDKFDGIIKFINNTIWSLDKDA